MACKKIIQDCFNPLNAELNPICYLLTLLGAHNNLHISRVLLHYFGFRLTPRKCLLSTR
jgi:hypothetical protein